VSAIHAAGFLSDTDIYALGTDETLSFYALQSEDEGVVEPKPRALGDVRGQLGVEYVVEVMEVGGEVCVVGGSYRYVVLSFWGSLLSYAWGICLKKLKVADGCIARNIWI
jgi:hypothetical protein